MLDPCVGGGTSAVETLVRGRLFVGFDINPLAVLVKDRAKLVDSGVSSSVRKYPGLTMVVWTPNGPTSGRRDSIQPSSPKFEAEYAVPNSQPTKPAPDEIVMS